MGPKTLITYRITSDGIILLTMLFFAALLAASVSANFEGGQIGACETVADRHLRCRVIGETDQDGRNRQASWYYFRVDAPGSGALTVDLVDLPGEYNYKPNRGAINKDTVPLVSYDQQTWKAVDSFEYEPSEPRLRIRLTPEKSTLWLARTPPYTNRHLTALLQEFHGSKALRNKSIGKTPEGRPIPLLTITDFSAPDTRKKVIWLMARQHSWESPTSWVAEGYIRYLLSGEAAALRRQAIFKVLPLCDPDGVARGGVRFNRQGYDLNRNWDTIDPKRTPEIAAEHAAILGWIDRGGRIDLFLSMHNTETGEYLEGPPDQGEHKALAERFFALLRDKTSFSPTTPLRKAGDTTTPGKPGRMTVIQGLYRDRKIPAFLTEQRIAVNPKAGRLLSLEDRKAFGAELARAMFEAVR